LVNIDVGQAQFGQRLRAGHSKSARKTRIPPLQLRKDCRAGLVAVDRNIIPPTPIAKTQITQRKAMGHCLNLEYIIADFLP